MLLCAAVALGVLGRRAIDWIQLLAVSVVAMLIYHPLDLYSAGFQLSFGTVLGLLVFTRPLTAMLDAMADRDLRLAPVPTHGIAAFWHRQKQGFKTTLVAGAVAWLVSAPLIAFHFGQLNPWAIPASIVLAPIVFLGLIGGLMKIVFTLLLPSFAGAWAMTAAWPMSAMVWTVDQLAKIPGSDVPLPAPPVLLIAVYYALLFAPLLPWKSRRARIIARCLPAVGFAALMLVSLNLRRAMILASPADFRVTLLAVGAGQCAVIEPASGPVSIIDAGSSSLSDLVRKCVRPYLRRLGEREIDTIFVSHPNYDHFSGVAELASAYDVRTVYLTPQFRDLAADNAPAEALLRTLDTLDLSTLNLHAGHSVAIDDQTVMEILWPPPQSNFDDNNTGQVMRLRHAGRTILFTADVQAPAQRELLKQPDAIKADVLIAPHHGSSESTTAAFVAAVNPKVILSSNDRTLSAKQRDFEGMIGGRPLYRTHKGGAITVTISDEGAIDVKTFLPGTR